MVVQSGAAQLGIFHGEAQWLNQMQMATGVGRQTNNIAAIGRNFWLEQNNVEHGFGELWAIYWFLRLSVSKAASSALIKIA